MYRKENLDSFNEYLVRLNRQIELLGKLNLNDLAVHSEDFFTYLFNLIFELNLINANFEKLNHEAIDLIDKSKNLIVQVSATCSKQKIENTLKKEILKNYASQDYSIQFIFVGKQNSNIKNNKFANTNKINFSPLNDIFLTEDLLKIFKSLSKKKQDEILVLMKEELPLLELKKTINNKLKVANKIDMLLKKNFLIWQNFGPHSESAIVKPLSMSVKKVWDDRKKEIFENNNEITKLINENTSLFTQEELEYTLQFEEHASIFKLNDTNRIDRSAYKAFPQSFKLMIQKIISESSD